MYQLTLNELTAAQFLAHSTGKKNLCSSKVVLPTFIDPISPDELAGLAAEEEEIESRIVSKTDGQWQLETASV